MKKYNIIHLIVLFLFWGCVDAQKQELIDQIDNNIQGIESFIQLSNMEIKFSPIVETEFDENVAGNFKNLPRNATLNLTKIQSFFDSLSVYSDIAYPYNLIEIDKDNHYLTQLLNKDYSYFSTREGENKRPKYYPIAVTYLDGTSENIENSVISNRSIEKKYATTEVENGQEYTYVETTKATPIEKYIWEVDDNGFYGNLFATTSPKPIKTIRFNIELPIETTETKTLSKTHTHFDTQFGKVALLGISGHEIVVQYPSALHEKIEIRGIYKDGRTLEQTSSNSNTVITQEGQKVYAEYIALLKKAKKKVKKNEIKNEDEFWKYIFKNEPENLDNIKHNLTQKTITFRGPVDKIDVLIPKEDAKVEQFSCNYTLNYKKSAYNYLVASDFETRKRGIISKTGKWLVQPQFDEYFRMQNAYFFRDQISGYDIEKDDTYHFNPQTNELKKVPYQLFNLEIYNEKYVIVERETNGAKGVVNVKTGIPALEVKYDYIWFQKPFWKVEINDEIGMYKPDFKLIIPFRNQYVDYEDGFFYVEEKQENVFDSQEDVYNKMGEKITKGKHYKINHKYSNNRLLVQAIEKKENGVNYYKDIFIDSKGNVVIDLKSKGLKDAASFSHGLALVKDKKTNLYGFIDVNGKIALPCIYKKAGFLGFFENSALAPVVLQNDDVVMIDTKGNIVKKLDENWKGTNYEENRKCSIYTYDDKCYDSFGNPVEE